MGSTEELVVALIHVKLDGVLVVSKQRVVSVRHVSQTSVHVEKVFNWGLVSAWLVPELLETEGGEVLEDLVA